MYGFFWLSSAKQKNLVWIGRQRDSWSCKSRLTNFIKSTTPLVVTPSSPPSIQIWTRPILRHASRPIENFVKSPSLAHSWTQTCICGRSLSTLPTKIFWNHRSFCWWVQSHLVIPDICLSHNVPILFTIIDIIFSGRRSPAILCQEWERCSTWRGALDFSFNKRNIYFQWISPTWNAFLSVAFYEDLFDKKKLFRAFFWRKMIFLSPLLSQTAFLSTFFQHFFENFFPWPLFG